MAVKTTIDREAWLVHHEVDGVLTFEEVKATISGLYGDPAFDPAMDVMMELKAGATSGLTSVEIIEVLDIFRDLGARSGAGRTVAVTPADADFGILRVLAYRLGDQPRSMRAFKTREQALAWLER